MTKEEIKLQIYRDIKEGVGGDYGFFSVGFDFGYNQADQQTKELHDRVEISFSEPIDITDIVFEKDGKIYFKQPTEKQVDSDAVELNIKLTEYCHKCGDGCCTNYGTITEINGKELPCHNQDAETILKQVLEHLGYKVNIETVTDYS